MRWWEVAVVALAMGCGGTDVPDERRTSVPSDALPAATSVAPPGADAAAVLDDASSTSRARRARASRVRRRGITAGMIVFRPFSTNGRAYDQVLADRDAIARGFARHAQRAFAPDRPVTHESLVRVTQSFDVGETRVPELVRAYFLADSFACGP